MIKKALLKILLATFPILTILGIYVATDPFKTLYHYDSFEPKTDVYISLNKGYMSTETYLNNAKKINYDSYIFGSSKSASYRVSEWQKHVTGNAFFHFDAYNEPLLGIRGKIVFLHNRGARIKNALIVVDKETLDVTTNSSSHLYRKHPLVSGENWLNFQLNVFKDFLDIDFLTAYLKYLLTKKVTPKDIETGFFGTEKTSLDEKTNEEIRSSLEQAIASNIDSYYASKKSVFYERASEQQYWPAVIEKEELEMLRVIKDILSAQKTNYKIVISPSYDQKKLNPADIRALESIFGAGSIYDFSGINNLTSDIHNYYESSHYRPQAATQIINAIYK